MHVKGYELFDNLKQLERWKGLHMPVQGLQEYGVYVS